MDGFLGPFRGSANASWMPWLESLVAAVGGSDFLEALVAVVLVGASFLAAEYAVALGFFAEGVEPLAGGFRPM